MMAESREKKRKEMCIAFSEQSIIAVSEEGGSVCLSNKVISHSVAHPSRPALAYKEQTQSREIYKINKKKTNSILFTKGE